MMSSEEWDSCREMRWAATSEVARRKRSCSGAESREEFFGVLVGLRPKVAAGVVGVVGVVATMVGVGLGRIALEEGGLRFVL